MTKARRDAYVAIRNLTALEAATVCADLRRVYGEAAVESGPMPAALFAGLDRERLERLAVTAHSRWPAADREWLHSIGGGIDFIEGYDGDVDERDDAAWLLRLLAPAGDSLAASPAAPQAPA